MTQQERKKAFELVKEKHLDEAIRMFEEGETPKGRNNSQQTSTIPRRKAETVLVNAVDMDYETSK
jgi:hypothetical protein